MSDAVLQLDGMEDEVEDSRMPFLRRFVNKQSITKREESILIAHRLIYNPHVDGRMRLTNRGRALLEEEGT